MPTWVSTSCKEGILTMNEYRTQEALATLWDDIEMHHLAYLQEDQNLMKLEEKRRLEALIKRYLTLVPPQKKFLFGITRQVLHDSIQVNEDFSCFKTASAWHGIATYAHNLLTQPWRKEFRVIKLFNGFYKHNIESSLIGGDLMLELMGYRKIKDNLMMLEGPVDPDRVAGVSKDSFIASVECQIMRSIYAEVFKNTKEIKWIDVFMHRETYAGTIEEAVAALSQHHNLYSFNYQHPTAFYQPSLYPVQPPVQQPLQYAISHQVLPKVPMDPVYQSDGYHYRQSMPDYHTSRAIGRGPQYATCPTAQLIEYEQPSIQASSAQGHHHHHHHHHHIAQQQVGQHHRRSSSDHAVSSVGGELSYIGQGRRPSYGYRTSSGSNNWDMDSDLWRPCSQEFLQQETKSNVIDQQNASYLQKDVASGGWPCPERHNLSQAESIEETISNIDALESSFRELWKDYLPSESKVKTNSSSSRKKKKNKYQYARLLPETPPTIEWSPDRVFRKPVVYSQSLRVNLDPTDQEQEKWNCQFCTYLNSPTKEVCEMCGKSKSNEEEEPLASGGRQCPQCTLVNKRGALTCDVCNSSLKDSATYI